MEYPDRKLDARNCYNCVHSHFCFLKFNVNEAVNSGIRMLNIDSNITLRGFQAVFEGLAMACMEFKIRETPRDLS